MKNSVDLHLIGHPLCPYSQRVSIALGEGGIDHERTEIDLANKPDWFTRASPLGRLPVLFTGDAVVFESAVICEYLEETAALDMHPADPIERAVHRSWIEFAAATLDAIAGFYNARDEDTFTTRSRVLRSRFERLERQLGEGPFFSGDRFRHIDAAWATVFRYFDTFDRIDDFGMMDGLEQVARYRAALANRRSVREAVSGDYPERLYEFLQRRPGYLAGLMETVN